MNASLTEEDKQMLIDETPVCKLGTPRDVANAALYLASSGAAFVTAQVLGVDGGII